MKSVTDNIYGCIDMTCDECGYHGSLRIKRSISWFAWWPILIIISVPMFWFYLGTLSHYRILLASILVGTMMWCVRECSTQTRAYCPKCNMFVEV